MKRKIEMSEKGVLHAFLLHSDFSLLHSNTLAFASNKNTRKSVRDLASFGESGVWTVPARVIG